MASHLIFATNRLGVSVWSQNCVKHNSTTSSGSLSSAWRVRDLASLIFYGLSGTRNMALWEREAWQSKCKKKSSKLDTVDLGAKTSFKSPESASLTLQRSSECLTRPCTYSSKGTSKRTASLGGRCTKDSNSVRKSPCRADNAFTATGARCNPFWASTGKTSCTWSEKRLSGSRGLSCKMWLLWLSRWRKSCPSGSAETKCTITTERQSTRVTCVDCRPLTKDSGYAQLRWGSQIRFWPSHVKQVTANLRLIPTFRRNHLGFRDVQQKRRSISKSKKVESLGKPSRVRKTVAVCSWCTRLTLAKM